MSFNYYYHNHGENCTYHNNTFSIADNGVTTSEHNILQCAIPLMSEGRDLLEPHYPTISPSNSACIAPNILASSSPSNNNWQEQIPNNVSCFCNL